MAQVKDLKIVVEKGSTASRAKITANFTIAFTAAEKRLNLQFGVFVMLYEVDFRPDILIPLPNGFNSMRLANLDLSMTRTPNTQDDAIGWMKSGLIVPNGKKQIKLQLHEEVRLIGKNVSNESFRAGVYVAPEISSGFAWSDEVRIPREIKPTLEDITANQTVQQNLSQQEPVIENRPVIDPIAPKKTPAVKATRSVKNAPIAKKPSAQKKVVKKPAAKRTSPIVKKPVSSTQVPSNTTVAKEVPKKAALKKKVVKKVIAKSSATSTTKKKTVPKKATIKKNPAKVITAKPIPPKRTNSSDTPDQAAPKK